MRKLNSLTLKLTAIVLFISLLSVVLVAVFTRYATVSAFDRMLVEQSRTEFIALVTAFYEEHGTWDGVIDAVRMQPIWQTEVPAGAAFVASAAVNDGAVVLADRDSAVYCLCPETGQQRWVFRTRGGVDSSPVIVGDRVFFGCNDGNVYGVSMADGQEVWRFRAGGPVSASPAVGQGRLVIGAEDGAVYCIGANAESEARPTG